MKGEFEKRMHSSDGDSERLTSFEIAFLLEQGVYPNFSAVQWIKKSRVKEMVDEAQKDFVEKEDRMKKVKELIEKHYPKEHGFSKRYVLDVIQVDIDLRRKWFGSEGGE